MRTIVGFLLASCAPASVHSFGILPHHQLAQFPNARCHRVVCCDADSGDEKRLIARTNNPALVWFDELFDTASERAERKRLSEENIAKWGKILRGADTFDDTLPPEDQLVPPVEMKTVAGIRADWLLVGGGSLVLLSCAAAIFGST